MIIFLNLFNVLIQIIVIAIFARVVIYWIRIDPDNPLVEILIRITEPILAPVRQIIPMAGPIDLSPIVAALILVLIQAIVNSLL